MGCGADSPQKRCRYGSFCCDNPSVSFADSSLYTREPWGAAAPVRQWDVAFKDKRRRALSERPYIHAGGAEVEGEVFGTGDPSPTRKTGVRRWTGGFLCPLSQKSKIFASSPIGRAKGAAAPVRQWGVAFEDKRRRAIDDRPYMRAGGAEVDGEVFGTGDPSPTKKLGVRQRIGRRQKDLEHGRSPYRNL